MLLVFGKKGSGKTTLVKKALTVNGKLNLKNIIIVDVNDEYKDLIQECIFDFNEMKFRLDKGLLPLRVFLTDENQNHFFDKLCSCKNFTLVIDELHIYSNPYQKSSGKLDKLIRLQRHNGIEFVGISQRVSEISRTATAQADKILTFKQTEPLDLKILEQRGFNPVEVSNLKKYKYLIKND
jgi:hypothetical protein